MAGYRPPHRRHRGFESGDHDCALAAARRGVEASRATTDERRADAFGILALTEATASPAAAPGSVADAWSLARASRSSASMASVAANVSLVLLQLQRPTEARAMLEEAAHARGPDAVPLFLLENLAWADLACGDAHRAAAGFGVVAGASSDHPADRRTAGLYAGAGCSLAALGNPNAATVLTRAQQLIAASALAVSPWQQSLIEAAFARVAADAATPADIASKPTRAPQVPLQQLRHLLRTEALAYLADAPEWWPRP